MSSLSRTKVICVDFDSTCTKDRFPGVGPSIGAEEWIKEWVSAGAKIILWTVRSGSYLDAAIKWFRDREISLWGIQTNPSQKMFSSSPKTYCSLYVDDKCFGIPLVYEDNEKPYVDWSIVGPKVLNVLKGE